MKWRFDNLETLNHREEMMSEIEKAAVAFIEKHPMLKTRMTAVQVMRLNNRPLNKDELDAIIDLQDIEVFLEDEFLKREKLEYLLNAPKGRQIREVAEKKADSKEEAWIIAHTWAYLRLHIRISMEQFIGWLNEKFDSEDELRAFLDKFNGKLWKINKWGWVCSVAPITQAESEDLDLFQSSMPMIVPPRKIGPKQKSPYLRRKMDCWTKKASVRHDELPWEALNIQNGTQYQINWSIWERFKLVIELPKRKENENDSQYKDR